MSMYLTRTQGDTDNTNAAPVNVAPGDAVTSSITTNPDGSTVKTTETARPDGSKTVVIETTDPQGHRTFDRKEFAGVTVAPVPPVNAGPMPETAQMAGNLAYNQQMHMESVPKTTQQPETLAPGQVYMSGPPPSAINNQGYQAPNQDFHARGTEKGFWTKRNKIIVGVVGALALVLIITLSVVLGTSSSSSTDDDGGIAGTSFDNQWPSEQGLLAGPSYETFAVTSLVLCAQQCETIGAKAGFFIPSQGQKDPATCGCEFDSTCLDPTLDVPGAEVFAQFPKPSDVCKTSLCDVAPEDALCTFSTPGAPPPTTSGPSTSPPMTAAPTPLPTTAPPPPPPPTPSPPSTSPQASLYFAAWFGETDPDDNCNKPQPGLTISCGVGATLDMLNSTDNSQCTPVGASALSCSATFTEVDISAWVLYACIGTTEQQWTTQVEAIPDTSVQCSAGGAAGTRIFLSQRCPGEDDDFNQMQCSPTSALGTNTDGLNNCLTFEMCTSSSCSLSTPAVGSSVGLSAISSDCLFPVSGGSPTPPTPTPPPPTPPVSGEVMSHWYQAEWVGVTTEQNLCIDPAPGLTISCGTGGSISILDVSPAATCQIVSGTETVSCTSLISDTTIPGLLYSCRGNTVASWTTRVEAIPDPSVSCQGGGAAGTRILIGKRCPNTPNMVDYNDVQCDPLDSLSVLSSGDDSCLTFDICLAETCDMMTLPVAAEIPESTIETSCLRP